MSIATSPARKNITSRPTSCRDFALDLHNHQKNAFFFKWAEVLILWIVKIFYSNLSETDRWQAAEVSILELCSLHCELHSLATVQFKLTQLKTVKLFGHFQMDRKKLYLIVGSWTIFSCAFWLLRSWLLVWAWLLDVLLLCVEKILISEWFI